MCSPVNEGSSKGVATSPTRAITAIRSAAMPRGRGRNSTVSAEPFIRGRTTTAVLGDRADGHRIEAQVRFYDFDAKYTEGMTEHVCPADSPGGHHPGLSRHRPARPQAARLQGAAAQTSAGMTSGGGGSVRAGNQHPARHDPAQPGALEQAAKLGISYGELVEIIIADALAEKGKPARLRRSSAAARARARSRRPRARRGRSALRSSAPGDGPSMQR